MKESYKDIKETLKNWPKLVKKYQKANDKKALTQVINTFLPFIGLAIISYYLYDYSIPLSVLCSIIAGLFTLRIFVIQHDSGHQSFFSKKNFNNICGTFCSFFSIIPFDQWSKEHNYHHAHTGDLSFREMGDIPTLTTKEFQKKSKRGQIMYKFIRSRFSVLFLSPFVYTFINNRFRNIAFKNWKKYFWELFFHNSSLVLIFGVLIYFLGWQKVLTVHGIILLTFAISAFWLFFVQHQHEEGYKKWKENWEYLLAAIKGSTFLKLPKPLQWISGSIGFHHIHHLSALIPNYNLEKCNKENPILEKYSVKIGMKDMLKMISNVLWDEELEKMITWKEYKQLYS